MVGKKFWSKKNLGQKKNLGGNKNVGQNFFLHIHNFGGQNWLNTFFNTKKNGICPHKAIWKNIWKNKGGVLPHRWKRYIDDILFLWRGSETELLEFVHFLNTFHPTIKFKCKKGVNFDFDTKKVDFLDTTLWIDGEGFIQSTLYTKPGRVVQYLLPSSSHPAHITQNIPYSLAYRLRRIESTEQLFDSNLEKLGDELLQRGYNKSSIKVSFNKVKSLSRLSTLEKVVKPSDGRLTLVIPFDKRLPNISGILRHRWQCLVGRDPHTVDYMSKPPRVAYTRTKSIQDIVVRSKVPPPTSRQSRRQVTMGFRKCDARANCSTCSHSVNTTTHTCNHTSETFPIASTITCTTSGVVYCVSCVKGSGECARCKGPQYIGCTERAVKTRFSEHVGSVTQPGQANTNKPVGVHFRSAGHTHADMSVIPIEKVRSKDRFVLEARERYWIGKYESVKVHAVDVIEHGLNLK